MSTQAVVIVGGGQAGFQAAASLRDSGFGGPVTLLAGEGVLPYQRPPLSKAYLRDPASGTSASPDHPPDADVVLRPESFYASREIDLVLGDRAAGIDRDGQQVVLASGRRIRYQSLVLATGAQPRPLDVPGARLEGVLALRTVADADRLRRVLRPGCRLVVVGAGMIGFELAATARGLGLAVTVVEALPTAMTRVASAALSAHLTAEQRARGVRVLFDRSVSGISGSPAGHVSGVTLSDGEYLAADAVVVAVGVAPSVGLAREAGLDVEDGIVVDEHLRTGDPAIYAIGDCARYPSRHAGGRIRLESVQNAVGHARHAAASICGESRPYVSVPWFWTDQHDLKVQIAGVTQGHDQAVIAGEPASGRFSVFCFRERRLLGLESVNRPGEHLKARRLLAAEDPGVTPEDIAGSGGLTPELAAGARA
jgi:3-phenylpropionate/trans-cinnamate dioxygenase ferredoxin reductase subunit